MRRDGDQMKRGDWGLVRINNPVFVWQDDPRKDPGRGLSEAEQEAYDNSLSAEEFQASLDRDRHFKSIFAGCSPYIGWSLMQACIDAGYQIGEGAVEFWLEDHLTRHIATHEPQDDGGLAGEHDDGSQLPLDAA